MKLLEGHAWVYTFHLAVVAPMLIFVGVAYLYQKQWGLSPDFMKALSYILIGFGVANLLYHGSKLRQFLI